MADQILCPDCSHDIDLHDYDEGMCTFVVGSSILPSGELHHCWCRNIPSDIARALLAAEPTYAEVEAARKALADEGADSGEGSLHQWRCFDRDRYPEPCTCVRDAAFAALSAAAKARAGQ